MNPDVQPTPSNANREVVRYHPLNLKERINLVLWEALPETTTLEQAEGLAVKLFNLYEEFKKND